MKGLALAALAAVGVMIGVSGALALRSATLTVHQPVPPGSQIELVLDARTRGGEHGQTLPEMVQAQVLLCRLEVSSDLVGDIEEVAAGRYRAVLAPSMDDSNRRQFRGCLEDWVIDHVRLDVVRLSPT
ncbi:MAG: hypothetical protein ACRD1D_05120 [Acidimicrobiales bacterium]